MATIIEMPRADGGTSYRIQVTITDRGTGKRRTETMTWRPSLGMRKKQLDYELEEEVKKFEEKCRQMSGLRQITNQNIKVHDYIPIFLKNVEKHDSKNYYANCIRYCKTIDERLGNYRVKELNPIIIQEFIDYLKSLTYTVSNARSINLPQALKENKIGCNRLAERMGTISNTTIKVARSGGTIGVEKAKLIAEALGEPYEKLFIQQEEIKPYAGESIAKVHRILKSMLTLAVQHMIIDRNCARAEYISDGIKIVTHHAPILDHEQASRALQIAMNEEKDIRIATAISLILLMEYRRGECVGLEWQDINIDKGTINISRSVSQVEGFGVVVGKPKTFNSEAETYMTPMLITQIKKYKLWWDDIVEKLGDKYTGSQRLFIGATGQPINPKTMYDWVKKFVKIHDLPDVHVHSLRTTGITVQLDSCEFDDDHVAHRARHGNATISRRKYHRILEVEDKKNAEKIDKLYGLS